MTIIFFYFNYLRQLKCRKQNQNFILAAVLFDFILQYYFQRLHYSDHHQAHKAT